MRYYVKEILNGDIVFWRHGNAHPYISCVMTPNESPDRQLIAKQRELSSNVA